MTVFYLFKILIATLRLSQLLEGIMLKGLRSRRWLPGKKKITGKSVTERNSEPAPTCWFTPRRPHRPELGWSEAGGMGHLLLSFPGTAAEKVDPRLCSRTPASLTHGMLAGIRGGSSTHRSTMPAPTANYKAFTETALATKLTEIILSYFKYHFGTILVTSVLKVCVVNIPTVKTKASWPMNQIIPRSETSSPHSQTKKSMLNLKCGLIMSTLKLCQMARSQKLK